jgi:hypothetical protein
MIKITSKVDNRLLHIVSRPQHLESGRVDIAPDDQILQLAALRLNKGRKFRAHQHIWKDPPLPKIIAQESWVVMSGSVLVSFYDINQEFLESHTLNAGDVSMTFEGGHSYEILDDNTFVYEYKTGPYQGQVLDKVFIGENNED